jgi:hypothetical protein
MRLRSDVRISVRVGTQPTRRIDLYRHPARRKAFLVNLDGRRSKKLEEVTATEVAARIRKWITP